MNPTKFCLPLLSFILLQTSLSTEAKADLGETPNEIEARYGAPVKTRKDGENLNVSYHTDKFLVVVSFYGGTSQSERYYMAASNGVSSNEAISAADIRRLMTRVGNGQDWELLSDPSAMDKSWKTKDGLVFCSYLTADGEPCLWMMSRRFASHSMNSGN